MGSICSCLRVDDDEEHEHSNAPAFRYCICLRCFTQQFINVYTVLLQRGEVHVAPSSVQGTAPLTSASVVEDGSVSDTYRSPPRPLPYDDPRCSRLRRQREGLLSRRDKASSHFHEESEPLRRRNNDTDIESAGAADKLNGSDYEGGSKLSLSESSLKHTSKEMTSGVTDIFSSSEDEDVCPTCLEEYASENPRITMKCSHHFHLSCIYEWMERSEVCPVCGKVMNSKAHALSKCLFCNIKPGADYR